MLHNSNHETILNEENEENTLAIYLEDEQISYIPKKDSGYTLDLTKSSCTNGVELDFDYNNWTIKTNYSNYESTDNTRVKCSLYFTDTYIEPLLNGTDPVLEEPLIPVTISDDGTVRKADLASEWYDYETKKWANAVILEDESKNYEPNEIIPEDAIESYFVWIPKYRYQLWDLGLYDSLTTIDTSKVHEIPIIFGDYNTSDNVDGECSTPMESGATGSCEVGDYMTHPAFLSIPSTGFWVGKFETGYKGATSTTEAQVNENDSSKVIIKPNVYSWRSVSVANAFYASYDYKRKLDSHMTKNTEWGAVAYLQHSAYGSSSSVRLNNNSAFLTGYQANDEPTCGYSETNEDCNRYCSDNTCNTSYPNSNLASTTGNILGVFDTSGDAWDWSMAFIFDRNNQAIVGRDTLNFSGFAGMTSDGTAVNGLSLPESRYYDSYDASCLDNQATYYNRILGDATGELGTFEFQTYISSRRRVNSWYGDEGSFMDNDYPIVMRGGAMHGGIGSGVMSFCSVYGTLAYHVSFRIVLTPTN